MIFYMHECEERLGYTFKDKNLLRACFTHSSYANEHRSQPCNERLEFFGDSVLGFLAAEYLVKKFPNAKEGELTEYKQNLVSRKPLSQAIEREGLGEFMLYGEGESRGNRGNRESTWENLFEAIVAGLYIDGGMEEAEKFVRRTLFSKVRLSAGKADGNTDGAEINHKSRLLEFVQKYKLGAIKYEMKSRSGPDHDPTFEMAVTVGGKEVSSAMGKNKSEAEKAAAKTAYGILYESLSGKGGKKKGKGDK
ncbi:MAG TPA: ribonuclease III [Clostridiales bacterium]|nr:ribonuclease III [Clostridiales bacterium]